MSNLDLERKRKDAMKGFINAYFLQHEVPSDKHMIALIEHEQSLDALYEEPEQDDGKSEGEKCPPKINVQVVRNAIENLYSYILNCPSQGNIDSYMDVCIDKSLALKELDKL